MDKEIVRWMRPHEFRATVRHSPLAPFERVFSRTRFRGFAMRKECEAVIKPGQAVLIVTYGNTTRKLSPLEGDLVVLGRAPTCDISLVSPEVAQVHCIFRRTPEGWRVRDCSGGRHATRINGRPIHDEEAVRDTDVLHIGTFIFEVRLPSSRSTPVPGSSPVVDDCVAARLKHLQRSRRNLVRLALRFRHRGRRGEALPPTLAELERQAQTLRGLQRDYEALVKDYEGRLGELEKAECEVCDERAALERECGEHQARLDKAEHDTMRRQAEMETQMKLRWEECQERCRQAEQAHSQLLQALPASTAGTAASQEWATVLDRRSQELNHFARYLRRCRQQSLQQTMPESHRTETEAGREKYEQMQAEWTAREAQLQQRYAELQAERAKAREEADALASKVKELNGIAESLTREIHDREAVLQKYRRQLEQQSAQANLEHSGSYERELNAYRLELERDRQELNELIDHLQSRQAEIEAAAREAEMQMSRERAVLAHERAELTRMREEIRISRERKTREGGVRERLAQLHSLKHEIAGLSPSAPGEKSRASVKMVTEDHPAPQSVG
jgi:chromosome segregation ATPase